MKKKRKKKKKSNFFIPFFDIKSVVQMCQLTSFLDSVCAVTQILFVFTKMFNKARDENAQQADAEKKKLEKEALKEQAAANSSARREGIDADHAKDIKTMLRNQSLSSKHRETRNGDS